MRLPDIPLLAPYVLVDQATQTYFLYVDASSAGESSVAVYRSKDLRDWSGPTKVYTVPSGGWADPGGGASAPEVHLHAGRYFLFTTLRNKKTVIAAAQQTPARATGASIWQNQTARATVIAVADSPLGPFVASEASFRITDASLMTLDGTLHTDPDGTPWMVFAQDWVQKVDSVMAAVKLKPGLTEPAAAPIWLFNGAQAPWYLDPQAGAPPGKPPANDLQFVPYADLRSAGLPDARPAAGDAMVGVPKAFHRIRADAGDLENR